MSKKLSKELPQQTNVSIHDPYAALRYRDYRLFAVGNMLAIMAMQMQSVAIGWELYERTGSALILGGVGLVQFLPVFLLALPAGHVADRFERKTIVVLMQILMALCSFALAWLSYHHGSIPVIYGVLMLGGIAQAFNNPAFSALLPQLVPIEVFNNAAVWGSSTFQIASVVGPALAGILIAIQKGAMPVYITDGIFSILCFTFIALIQGRQAVREAGAFSLKNLVAGLRFVRDTKIILAALTLDMFAVLLGGVTTLLPIFARDILHVGPVGLGWLRAAPSIGALTMALAVAHLPPIKQAGKTLLWVVIGFGLTTIVFGVSTWFWLSMAMLVLNGALDNISVIIRWTLVQVGTPDAMRGRVSAVNSVFIGSSNELGGFESGLVAAWFGPVASAVIGGVGTIVVVVAVTMLWPQIRQLGSLNDLKVMESPVNATS